MDKKSTMTTKHFHSCLQQCIESNIMPESKTGWDLFAEKVQNGDFNGAVVLSDIKDEGYFAGPISHLSITYEGWVSIEAKPCIHRISQKSWMLKFPEGQKICSFDSKRTPEPVHGAQGVVRWQLQMVGMFAIYLKGSEDEQAVATSIRELTSPSI